MLPGGSEWRSCPLNSAQLATKPRAENGENTMEAPTVKRCMAPQERYYDRLMRNMQLLRTSETNVSEAMLKRCLGLINLLIFSQLGLLARGS